MLLFYCSFQTKQRRGDIVGDKLKKLTELFCVGHRVSFYGKQNLQSTFFMHLFWTGGTSCFPTNLNYFQTRLNGNATELILINRGDTRPTGPNNANQAPESEQAAQGNSTEPTTRQLRPLDVRITTEQSTANNASSFHRTIQFSHSTASDNSKPPTLTVDRGTSCDFQAQSSSSTMNSDVNSAAEQVANEVVQTVMEELFDIRQLEQQD
jgi:hypothetical protein